MTIVVAALGLPGLGRAAEPVVEKLERAEIDWTAGAIVATGSGAPDRALENVAQIRLQAERAAKRNGQRHVLAAIERMQVTVDATGADRLADPAVRAQVEGVVETCKVQDTRYYSDGGVDVVIRCPIEGGLATALAPAGARAPLPEGSESTFTGLVVDASGVRVSPILLPTLIAADDEPLLEPKTLSAEALRTTGAVVYVRSLGEATAHPRAGASPLVLDVIGLDRRRGWRVDEDDARKLRGVDQGFLRDGKIVVVVAGR